MNANELKAYAKNREADIIGIAGISRFDGLAPDHHPQSIFPETKSVIVLGKQIPRGIFRGVEEGTNFQGYGIFGLRLVGDRILPLLTISIAEFLEDRGYEAVALPNLPPQTPPMGISVKPDLPPPNVMIDFNDAAVRAGLGEIGYSGEFMTPQFGTRQRLQVILTDAELPQDPILDEPVCDRCKLCAESCPLGAFDTSAETTIEICGKKMPVANIDSGICAICKNGAQPNPYHPSGLPDKLAAICNRTCIHHLDTAGKRFRTDFRKRAAWQVDINGKASLVKEGC